MAVEEAVRVREVQLGLQGFGHGRPLSHARRDPQLGTGAGVDVVRETLDHVCGLAGGPDDFVVERVDPLLAQPELLVILGAMGSPIAVHRGRQVVGEERAEPRP